MNKKNQGSEVIRVRKKKKKRAGSLLGEEGVGKVGERPGTGHHGLPHLFDFPLLFNLYKNLQSLSVSQSVSRRASAWGIGIYNIDYIIHICMSWSTTFFATSYSSLIRLYIVSFSLIYRRKVVRKWQFQEKKIQDIYSIWVLKSRRVLLIKVLGCDDETISWL